MTRQATDAIIHAHVKQVFGFALKRCRTLEDAEDLAQDILCRAYRTLLLRDDIADPCKFLWAIAQNALKNYYRGRAKSSIGVSMDAANDLADPQDLEEALTSRETLARLQWEIAYLSRMQRQIVIAYWFERKKQADIARQLGIPEGTVKWHLFEAKKELKKGMNTMRQSGELKFNPVHFTFIGINGSSGTDSPERYLSSVLAQNLCYCVRDEWKTLHQIADEMGVSPVYVEDEAARLEEYGLLQAQDDRYIANFIIDEPTPELLNMQDQMYRRAAALIAGELHEELMASGLLDDPAILCGQGDGDERDKNYLLWTLLPYIAARSGETQLTIPLSAVATIHPDGGQNIVKAGVSSGTLPEGFLPMRNWCGPMWNGACGCTLWQINSEWCSRERVNYLYSEDSQRVLSLYTREKKERLSRDEYAWLAERGFVKLSGDWDGLFRAAWQPVILRGADIERRLLAIGDRVKARHQAELDALKSAYTAADLAQVPAHLRKVRTFEHQFIFQSDGWFLLHCLTWLTDNGHLKPVPEEQKAALTTLILDPTL